MRKRKPLKSRRLNYRRFSDDESKCGGVLALFLYIARAAAGEVGVFSFSLSTLKCSRSSRRKAKVLQQQLDRVEEEEGRSRRSGGGGGGGEVGGVEGEGERP